MTALSAGMDPDRVEEIGRRLQAEAGRLETLGRQIAGTIDRASTVWSGPDARMFQDRWRGEWQGLLNRAMTDIDRLGSTALSQAAEQRQASAAGGSAGGSSSQGSARGEASGPRSPSSVGDMLDYWHRGADDDGNGFRIQVGVGPDGRKKAIVYIAGTNGDELLTWGDNILTASGESRMAIYLRIMLSQVIDSDTDVLFVGYSQGGMVAEELAYSGHFNSATVITEAAPPSGASRAGVDVLRLTATTPANDAINVPLAQKRFGYWIGDQLAGGTDRIDRTHYGRSIFDVYGDAGQAVKDGGWSGVGTAGKMVKDAWTGDHTNHDLYRQAAAGFEASNHPDDVALQEKISQFTDLDLVYDSDDKSMTDRSRIPR